jgi:hypothetical protein
MHNKNLKIEKEVVFEVSSHQKWEREREREREREKK